MKFALHACLLSVLIPTGVHAQSCMSVPVTTPRGKEAFVGFRVRGSKIAIEHVVQAVIKLGLTVIPASRYGDNFEQYVFFDDHIVTPEQAIELFKRVEEGDLSKDGSGKVTIEANFMPISIRQNCKK